jgi:hypothetical protein
MYIAKSTGGTTGKSGRKWHWNKGEVHAPKGELDHVSSLEWKGDLSKKEIKAQLDEKGVEYDGRSSKEDLEKLLNA